MHELCECKRGEGFKESFDAHLNFEQMNETFVELFQLYDDHIEKGKSISTEREFRSYCALLKMDNNPGYKLSFLFIYAYIFIYFLSRRDYLHGYLF